MMRRQEALGEIVGKDPAVATYAMAIGAGGSSATLNNGRMFITLKPQDERDVSARRGHRPAAAQAGEGRGRTPVPAAAQDVNVGGRASRTQFQYTLQDANLDELNAWAPKVLEKLKTLPQLRDVATDQQTAGTTLTLDIDRDQASRYGLTPQLIDDTLYDAFGQRQVAQYFTQQNSYHVVMEILPELQGERTASTRSTSARRPRVSRCRSSTFAKWTTRKTQPLSISHQGQFPAVTISFNLGAGRIARHGDRGHPAGRARDGLPASLSGTSRATPRHSRHRCARVPLLILAALFVVYLILGMLYESYIHPLTILSTLPSAGARRARDADGCSASISAWSP